MSAWVCSQKHINSIVRAAEAWGKRPSVFDPQALSWQEIAEVLLAENVRSVNYRYGRNDPVPAIVYSPRTPLRTALVILKACNSLDYQSCETPDWDTTRAYRILQQVKDYAIHSLPGYAKAKGWNIE